MSVLTSLEAFCREQWTSRLAHPTVVWLPSGAAVDFVKEHTYTLWLDGGSSTIGTFINPLNGIGVSVRNTPWLPPEVGRARIQRPKTLAGKLGTPLNPLSPRANTRMWTQEVLWMVEA